MDTSLPLVPSTAAELFTFAKSVVFANTIQEVIDKIMKTKITRLGNMGKSKNLRMSYFK